MLKSDFYRDCYMQTGWIPMQPLMRPVALGDVCQIHHGYFQPLMNIDQIDLVEPVAQSNLIPLNPIDWRINRGVQQTFCSHEEYTSEARPLDEQTLAIRTKQALLFNQAGSYMFYGDQPGCNLLLNWNQIKQDTTLKLTQSHFSFRDIYVVTGVASMSHWALAIAGEAKAQLEMTASTDTTDQFLLFSHASAKAELCRDIATYERSHSEKAYFFQAKKMVLSDEMHDKYLLRLLENQNDFSRRAVANWFNSNLLNLIRSNEQNLTSTISFFDWVDASLDDVERLLR
ncbi:MAG: hypothetical protein COA42_06425 [Alteromonadaceae bacterium]|nr:MAG: hypothetical protein COA42_06425 [Alteromonadaceae bacterium]